MRIFSVHKLLFLGEKIVVFDVSIHRADLYSLLLPLNLVLNILQLLRQPQPFFQLGFFLLLLLLNIVWVLIILLQINRQLVLFLSRFLKKSLVYISVALLELSLLTEMEQPLQLVLQSCIVNYFRIVTLLSSQLLSLSDSFL